MVHMVMVEKVQSAGGLVYYIDPKDNEVKFLLVKRFALSKKVERIAPKGKIQKGEMPQQAAVREISEETGLKQSELQIKDALDTLSLQLYNVEGKLGIDKDITYYLVHYVGDPTAVVISDSEGFLGVHKRATIQDILSLVMYRDLRELFRKAYGMIGKINVRDEFIKNL